MVPEKSRSKILFSSLLGGIIYMSGDSIAALIAGDWSWVRALGIFVLGATIYAYEIPRYFRWIEQKIAGLHGQKKKFIKTLLALIYFNPLWIARHLVFVYLCSGKATEIGFDLIGVALISFLVNIPLSVIVNYLIQNKVSLKYRFFCSAVFSGLMAIYYSMSSVWF